jgi:hypothetical protein
LGVREHRRKFDAWGSSREYKRYSVNAVLLVPAGITAATLQNRSQREPLEKTSLVPVKDKPCLGS